jgi:hypothetical protein
MIDLEAHYGRSGRIVSCQDFLEITAKDQVTVEPGDFVLFRNGFAEMLLEMNKQPDRQKLFDSACGWTGRKPAAMGHRQRCGRPDLG